MLARTARLIWILASYRCSEALDLLIHQRTHTAGYKRIEGITVRDDRSKRTRRLVAFLRGVERIVPQKGDRTNDPLDRLTTCLTELGPSFIKLAQILSVRSDLVGESAAQALSRCQDRLPFFPFKAVEQTLAEDFGSRWCQLYQQIDPVPVAAASIAQVHKAVTSDGRTVAVKVLRPGIDAQFARDLRWFGWITQKLNQHMDLQHLKLPDVIEEYRSSISIELDLTLEAASAEKIRASLNTVKYVEIPQVDWDRTSERILCITWIDGCKIDDLTTLDEWNIDRKKLIQRCAKLFFRQVFRDGFFHADLHPGNVLVDRWGTVWLLDFGIMGYLSEHKRLFISEVILGFLKRDYLRMALAHQRYGIIPPEIPVNLFALKLRSVGEPLYGKNLDDFSIGSVFRQVIHASVSFNVAVKTEFLLMHRSLILVEGIARRLNPQMDIWSTVAPMIEPWSTGERRLIQKLKHSRDIAGDLHTLYRRIDRLTQAVDDQVIPAFTSWHNDLTKQHQQHHRRWLIFVLGILSGIAIASLMWVSIV